MNDTMQKANPTSMMGVEASREIAEIQARMLLARQFPRDENYCLGKILKECENPKLAEVAQYSYPKGGTEVRGPSIRLIEVIGRHWGNVISGIKELSKDSKGCTVKAYAWDLESNMYDEKVFDVSFVRNTKKGSYAITDEREKYELMANYAARRKRACLQAIIPGYIVDEAAEVCAKTLTESLGEKPLEELRQSLFDAFALLVEGVTKEMLENVVSKDFDKWSKEDVVRLKRLYTAIKEGFAKPEVVLGTLDNSRADLPSEDEESAAAAIVEQLGVAQ